MLTSRPSRSRQKSRGTTSFFLKLPDYKKENSNPIRELISGKSIQFRYVPITGYIIDGNTLLVNKYVDEDTTVQQVYDINVITDNKPVSIKQYIISKNSGLARMLLEGIFLAASLSEHG